MSEAPTAYGDPGAAELIEDLLKGAAAAHHVYDTNELGGVRDDDWPGWYARHMAVSLANAGYRIVPADGPVDIAHPRSS